MATNGSIRKDILDYIDKAPLATLATVRAEGAPALRTIAAFAQTDGGKTIYFLSGPGAEKTHQIAANANVAFLIQHEGQELARFRNVAVNGIAKPVTAQSELERAAALLAPRSPYVKDRLEKEGFGAFAFYHVTATEVKFLDYSKGIGPSAVETIKV